MGWASSIALGLVFFCRAPLAHYQWTKPADAVRLPDWVGRRRGAKNGGGLVLRACRRKHGNARREENMGKSCSAAYVRMQWQMLLGPMLSINEPTLISRCLGLSVSLYRGTELPAIAFLNKFDILAPWPRHPLAHTQKTDPQQW